MIQQVSFNDLKEIAPISDKTPTINIPLPIITSLGINKDLFLLNEENQSLISMTILFRNNQIIEQPGLKKLASKLIGRGTAKRNAQQISEQFDFFGASYSFSSNFETFAVNLTSLHQHFEQCLEILFDSLFNSTFSESEIQKVTKELEADLLFRDSDPDSLCGLAFSSSFYKGHYYQHPFGGYSSSLKVYQPDDLKKVYFSILENSKIDVFLTGSIENSLLDRINREYFSQLTSQVLLEQPVFENTNRKRHSIIAHKDQSKQVVVKVGQNGIAPTHPDSPALNMLISLFGGSILGRLSLLLREQKGYTYGAFAGISAKSVSSELVAFTSVGNEYLEDTLVSIFDEWERLKYEPIETEELLRTKQYLLGSYSRLMETPQKLLSMFVKLLQQNLPMEYPLELIDYYGKLDVDTVNTIKQKHIHPESLTIGLCADSSIIANKVEQLTTLEYYQGETS
jgi:predicted Zn-dependent peptidase